MPPPAVYLWPRTYSCLIKLAQRIQYIKRSFRLGATNARVSSRRWVWDIIPASRAFYMYMFLGICAS